MTERPLQSDCRAVLLVCTANVIRSPLAAAMLRQHLSGSSAQIGLAIQSAGLVASPGQQVTPGAQAIARRMGMDLSGHRSRPVTRDLMEHAEIVLTMTEAHRAAVLRQQPSALSRTFTLPEFVRLSADRPDAVSQPSAPADRAHRARPRTRPADGPEDVPDPIGRPMENLECVARQLDRLTGTVAGVIRG